MTELVQAWPHPHQGRLSSPLVRDMLIRLLARGDTTIAELGRQHGVSYQSIQRFARRHDTEIAAMVIHLGGTPEQWARAKRARIAECAALVAEIEQDASAPPEVTQIRLEALRAAADDLSRPAVCA